MLWRSASSAARRSSSSPTTRRRPPTPTASSFSRRPVLDEIVLGRREDPRRGPLISASPHWGSDRARRERAGPPEPGARRGRRPDDRRDRPRGRRPRGGAHDQRRARDGGRPERPRPRGPGRPAGRRLRGAGALRGDRGRDRRAPGVAVAAPVLERRTYPLPGSATATTRPPVTVLGVDPDLDAAIHDRPLASGSGLPGPATPARSSRSASPRTTAWASVHDHAAGRRCRPDRVRVVGILGATGRSGPGGRSVVVPLRTAQGIFATSASAASTSSSARARRGRGRECPGGA